MSGHIFLAGILQFQSRQLFEEALEAIRSEEDYSEGGSLVSVFAESMITETIMVLRHHAPQGAAFYDRLMAEAYLLSEFAGRGYVVGVLRGASVRVQVAMAAMTHAVVDEFAITPDPPQDQDYLPRLSHHVFTYRYDSEGNAANLQWRSQPSHHGHWDYISFPSRDSDDPFNDWWDGHYYLKSGTKWYSVATDLDTQALSDPAPEELQLIMDGGAQPGNTCLTYVPGTESFKLYTHEGFEEVETPLGHHGRCMKVRVDLYFLPTDETRYVADELDRAFKRVTTTHYFAKGLGLVWLKFQYGDLQLTGLEAGAPQPQAPVAAAAPKPAAEQLQTPPAGEGKKPWWRFW